MVMGTSSQPVKFTAASATWSQFQLMSMNATLYDSNNNYLSGPIIEYVNIDKGGVVSVGSNDYPSVIYTYNTAPYFTHVSFSSVPATNIQWDSPGGASVIVADNLVIASSNSLIQGALAVTWPSSPQRTSFTPTTTLYLTNVNVTCQSTEYADIAGLTNEYALLVDMVVDQAYFSGCYAGLQISGGGLSLSNTLITGITYYGITTSDMSSNTTLTNVTFVAASTVTFCLSLSQYPVSYGQVSISVVNSSFLSCSGGGAIFYLNAYSATGILLDVRDNLFQQNSNDALSIDASYYSTVVISNNVFTNNTYSAYSSALYISVSSLLNNLTVSGNSFSLNNGYVNLAQASQGGTTAYYDSACTVNLIKDTSTQSTVFFVNNTLYNNTALGTICLGPQSSPYSYETWTEINDNFIVNPASVYEFYALSSANDNVDASLNWWGEPTERLIDQRVYDELDNTASPLVNIFPYLLSANVNNIVPLNTSRSTFGWDANNSISGVLTDGTATIPYSAMPYTVNEGDILVRSGATLVIEPGVVILFGTSKNLRIEGELIAAGTPAEHIVFGCAVLPVATGCWGSVQFAATAVGASFANASTTDAYAYASGSIIQYVDFSYGGSSGGNAVPAISAITSSPFVSQVTISYAAGGVMLWTNLVTTGETGTAGALVVLEHLVYNNSAGGCGATLLQSTAPSNAARTPANVVSMVVTNLNLVGASSSVCYGSNVQGFSITYQVNVDLYLRLVVATNLQYILDAYFPGAVYISNATSFNSYSTAISVVYGGFDVTVQYGYFYQTSDYYGSAPISIETYNTPDSSVGNATISVLDNVFLNGPYGPQLYVYSQTESLDNRFTLLCQRNVLSGANSGFYFELSSIGAGSIISDNTIHDIVLASSQQALFVAVSEESTSTPGPGIVITRNSIYNISGSNVVLLTGQSGANFSFWFTYNDVSGNTAQGVVTLAAYSSPPNVGAFYINYNYLANPASTYDLYVLAPLGQEIDARYNWWGTASERSIDQHKYDFLDSPTSASADIFPYLESRDTSDVVALNTPRFTFSIDPNGAIAGVITSGTVVLPAASIPYTVTENDLIVMPGATLVIYPGTIVQFGAGRSLRIMGTLVASGTAAQPVTFTCTVAYPSSNVGCWNGVLFSGGNPAGVFSPSGAFLGGSVLSHTNILYSASGVSISSGGTPYFDHTWIQYTSNGPCVSLVSFSDTALYFNAVNISACYGNGITVHPYDSAPPTSFSFSNSIMQNMNSYYGIQFLGNTNAMTITLQNSTFNNLLFYTVYVDGQGSLSVEDCIFQTTETFYSQQNGYWTVYFFSQPTTAYPVQSLTVLRSTFSQLYGGSVYVYPYTYNIQGTINTTNLVISDCTFSNNYRDSVALELSAVYSPMTVLVQRNVFTGSSVYSSNFQYGDLYVDASQYVTSVTIIDNTFTNNNHPLVPVLQVDAGCPIVVEANAFFSNIALTTVTWENYQGTSIGPGLQVFWGNNLKLNQSPNNYVTMLINSGGQTASFDYNFFDNSYNTDAEVKTSVPNGYFLNMTSCWWGGSPDPEAAGKLYDFSESSSLATILYVPVLAAPVFPCDTVNNCTNSSHGSCILPQTCLCETGWGTADCGQYVCVDVFGCGNNGLCIGPNTCSCNPGWLPPYCLSPTCPDVNQCSNQGVCSSPDVCLCNVGYAGADCSQCDEGYYVFNSTNTCVSCPACGANGVCNAEGTCTCTSPFTGPVCTDCLPTFHGPACLPLPWVVLLVPSYGSPNGGTPVYIGGDNLVPNPVALCRFGTFPPVPAAYIAQSGELLCYSPVNLPLLQTMSVPVEISIDNGTTYTDNGVLFTYYAACANNCSQQGVCVEDVCACDQGWTSFDCSEAIVPPTVRSTSLLPQVVVEGVFFTGPTPSTASGTAPFIWSVQPATAGAVLPVGVTINPITGVIAWPVPIPQSSPYYFLIGASNAAGFSTGQLEVTVQFGYTATIRTLSPPEYSPQVAPASPLQISGTTTSLLIPGVIVPNVPVIIVLASSAGVPFVVAKAVSDSAGDFSATYYPSVNDAGDFSVWAQHPLASMYDQSGQAYVTIYGATIVQGGSVNLVLTEGTPVVDASVATLVNFGDDDLYIVSVTTPSTSVGSLSDVSVSYPDTSYLCVGSPLAIYLSVTATAAIDVADAVAVPVFIVLENDISLNFTVLVSSLPATAPVVSVWNSVSGVVKGGAYLLLSCQIENTGAVAFAPYVTANYLPAWMSVVSSAPANLQPGDFFLVELLAIPDLTVATETYYNFNFSVQCGPLPTDCYMGTSAVVDVSIYVTSGDSYGIYFEAVDDFGQLFDSTGSVTNLAYPLGIHVGTSFDGQEEYVLPLGMYEMILEDPSRLHSRYATGFVVDGSEEAFVHMNDEAFAYVWTAQQSPVSLDQLSSETTVGPNADSYPFAVLSLSSSSFSFDMSAAAVSILLSNIGDLPATDIQFVPPLSGFSAISYLPSSLEGGATATLLIEIDFASANVSACNVGFVTYTRSTATAQVTIEVPVTFKPSNAASCAPPLLPIAPPTCSGLGCSCQSCFPSLTETATTPMPPTFYSTPLYTDGGCAIAVLDCALAYEPEPCFETFYTADTSSLEAALVQAWLIGTTCSLGSSSSVYACAHAIDCSPLTGAHYQLEQLLLASSYYENLIQLLVFATGDAAWLDAADPAWTKAFLMALGASSPDGAYLSTAEATGLLSSCPLSVQQCSDFLQRANHTIANDTVANGAIDMDELAYLFATVNQDTGAISTTYGVSNSILALQQVVSNVLANHVDNVNLQSLLGGSIVLTSDVSAVLDGANTSPLKSFTVVAIVTNTDANADMSDVVLCLTVFDSSGVDPLDSLAVDVEPACTGPTYISSGSQATFTFAITPFMTVIEPETIFVGGVFNYTQVLSEDGGDEDPSWPITSLLPMTVLPSPLLGVRAFVPVDAFADNPFTSTWTEPTVPAIVGLQVGNLAFSASPIGGLVLRQTVLKIADIQNATTEPFVVLSAVVDEVADQVAIGVEYTQLGTLSPSSMSQVRYSLVVAVEGTFVASEVVLAFQQLDPTDPTSYNLLPIYPTVYEQHVLEHTVLLPASDSALDWLVNDDNDTSAGLPAHVTVYSSEGFDVLYSVSAFDNLTTVGGLPTYDATQGMYLAEVEIFGQPPAPGGLVYMRGQNPIGYLPVDVSSNLVVVRVQRSDDLSFVDANNAWETFKYAYDVAPNATEDYLHIFDEAPLPPFYIVYFGAGSGYLRPFAVAPVPPQVLSYTAGLVQATPTPSATASASHSHTASRTNSATSSRTATATPTLTAAPTTLVYNYPVVVYYDGMIPSLESGPGQTAQFGVQLGHAIGCSVTVPITPSASYPDISAGTTALVFAPSSWDVVQAVELTSVATTETISPTRNVSFVVGPAVSSCNAAAFSEHQSALALVYKFPPLQPILDACQPAISDLRGGEAVTCYGSGLQPDGSFSIKGQPVSFQSFVFGCPATLSASSDGYEEDVDLANCTATFTFVAPTNQLEGYVELVFSNPDNASYVLSHTFYYANPSCAVVGYYVDPSGACVPCPSGGVCPGGDRIWAEPGYWNGGEGAGGISQCIIPDACLGTDPQTGNSSCAAGYQAAICGSCAAGYYAEGEYCLPCGTTAGLVFLFLADIVFAGLIALSCIFLQDKPLSVATMVITGLQMFRAVGQLTQLPGFLGDIYMVLSYSTMDINTLRLDCVSNASDGFEAKFWGQIILFAGYFVLVVGSVLLAPRFFARTEANRVFFHNRRYRATLIVLCFFYFSMTVKILQGLTCVQIAGLPDKWLLADTVTQCFVGEHLGVTVVAAFLLAGYSLTLPTLLAILLYRFRFRLEEDKVKSRLGTVYTNFLPHSYMAYVVYLCVMFLEAIAVAVLVNNRPGKVALSVVPAGLLAILCLWWRPFTSLWQNIVVFAVLCLVCAGMIISVIAWTAPLNTGMTAYISILLVITGLVLIGLLILYRERIVKLASDWWHRKPPQPAAKGKEIELESTSSASTPQLAPASGEAVAETRPPPPPYPSKDPLLVSVVAPVGESDHIFRAPTSKKASRTKRAPVMNPNLEPVRIPVDTDLAGSSSRRRRRAPSQSHRTSDVEMEVVDPLPAVEAAALPVVAAAPVVVETEPVVVEPAVVETEQVETEPAVEYAEEEDPEEEQEEEKEEEAASESPVTPSSAPTAPAKPYVRPIYGLRAPSVPVFGRKRDVVTKDKTKRPGPDTPNS